MTVLDASAVLALIHNESGSDIVAGEIASAVLGAANLAEVVASLSTLTSMPFVSANCSAPPASPSNR